MESHPEKVLLSDLSASQCSGNPADQRGSSAHASANPNGGFWITDRRPIWARL